MAKRPARSQNDRRQRAEGRAQAGGKRRAAQAAPEPITPSPKPPPIWEVEMLAKQLTTGRTKPLLVVARDPEGAPHHVVLKTRGDAWPAEFLVEWVSSWVGRALGLRCAEIVALSVDSSFASTLQNDLVDRLIKSCGRVAGSVWFHSLSQPPQGKLSKSQQDEAQRILGFDVYIHNPDRRAHNPNLGQYANGFALYDHEQALGFRIPGMLIGSIPETDPCRGIVQQHIFFQPLKKMRGISMAPFGGSLAALTDDWFAELRAAAPPEWLTRGCQVQLTTIIDVLRKRRDLAAAWLKEVQECLM